MRFSWVPQSHIQPVWPRHEKAAPMSSKPGLKESAFEDIDETLHEVDELTKRWHQRLTVNNLALAERYLKNEMSLGLIFRKKKGNSEKFIAFFQRELGFPRLPSFRQSAAFGMRKLDTCEIRPNRNDGAVFINNVQSLQTPEGITFSSTVRLQMADDFFDCRADALKKSRSSALRPGEIILAPVYWEVGFLQDTFTNIAIAKDEASGERVNCAHKVMDDIPDKTAPGFRDWFFDMKSVDFDRWLRILIYDDFVRVSFLKGRDLGIEIIKVLYGPSDLYPATQ